MMRLVYERLDDKKFINDCACISHLYDEEAFDCEVKYNLMGTDLSMDVIKGYTAYGLKPPNRKLFIEYRKLVEAYIDDHLNGSFGLDFHLHTPKLYVLAILNFLRTPHEEGEWFMRGMLNAEGSLFDRLFTVIRSADGSGEYVNRLHQPFWHTITGGEWSDAKMMRLGETFNSFLYFLKDNGSPVYGSQVDPNYEDTMDYALGEFFNA